MKRGEEKKRCILRDLDELILGEHGMERTALRFGGGYRA